jgi:hypothetical protein
VAPPARSTARRATGSTASTRQTTSPMPSSIPATWNRPNRSANSTAVVEAGVGTADNASPAVSARRRSNPVQNSAPNICACATATRNCPADRPRSRCLIEPTASSSAALTPSRPTTSATATTPETGVNDASGAPMRTRPAKPGIFSTERVSFPQRPIGVSTTPIVPAGKASVRLCHAVLYSYPRIRVRPIRVCLAAARLAYRQGRSSRPGGDGAARVASRSGAVAARTDREAGAVKDLVDDLTRQYAGVDYAFLTVSEDHDWMLLDRASPGIGQGTRAKGRYVPARGHTVRVSGSEILVSVCGPRDLKLASHGAPRPLLVKLHRESTFTDLDYLAGQVFRFTALSWRRPYPSSRPVTILYSDQSLGIFTGRTSVAIAELLGQQAIVFPSHHGGFLGGEFGYAGQPRGLRAQTARGPRRRQLTPCTSRVRGGRRRPAHPVCRRRPFGATGRHASRSPRHEPTSRPRNAHPGRRRTARSPQASEGLAW